MMVSIYQVDAFTGRPFLGNPAAVCVLPGRADEEWMQNVAREMNLSETAFLYKDNDGFNLRWFTPAVEVDLCGHATLASAHILWEKKYLETGEEAKFYTRNGILSAALCGDRIELNFPAKLEEEAQPPGGLIEALGVRAKYVGKNSFDYLIEVESEAEVRAVKPDFALLRSIPVRGVMITSIASSGEYDFVSRFFAPAVGVNEDPVTGSAHCCLGPYWGKKLNKKQLIAYQASERGGQITVRLNQERVFLGGQAVTVMEGKILV
jgi:PhzF family phenazine biosynthesis protein